MTTLLFGHQSSEEHDMGPGHPECPDRIRVVQQALEADRFDSLENREAPRATVDQIARVHDRDYVTKLLDAVPGEGRVQIDPDTAMCPDSGEAALRASGAIVAAIDAIAAGETNSAFCAVRPPGHHAEPSRGMGFCLFNNVAIGVEHARKAHNMERVAVVDFDVHHGNGTEALVRNLEPTTVTNKMTTLFCDVTMESPSYKPWLDEEDSSNVFFCSMHGYGHGFYPSSGRTGSDRPVFNVGWPLCKDKDQASREVRFFLFFFIFVFIFFLFFFHIFF